MINRNLFIETINAIDKQDDWDILNAERLSDVHTNAFTGNLIYNNSYLQNALIKLLQVEFKDEHTNSWIEYYCWELKFGKNYTDGCVTRKDKTIVDISDAGKLYDWLIECRE